MSELPPVLKDQVTCRYVTGGLISARNFILALSPIWLVWSLVVMANALGCLLGLIPATPADNPQYVTVIGFCLALIGLSFLALRVCADYKLSFDSQSIKFPSHLLLELKGRLRRSWSELKQVDFVTDDGNVEHPRTVSFVFKDCAVPLAIKGLGQDTLRQLVLAISAHAPAARFVPELSQVDLAILPQSISAAGVGLHATYTQLWESELSERFGSTSFVPMVPGDRLRDGKIKIVGQLAFGGLSAVYLAELADSSLAGNCTFAASQVAGQAVVLKEAVLPVSVGDDARFKALSMFEREAQLLAAVKHERIASVLDFFQERGRSYLVLDHIEGTDLRHFVRDSGKQSALVVTRWLCDIAELLQYLHGLNPPLIHRDITPDNIVLTPSGRLCLIDFGAANTYIGTATGTVVGKQSYIAPEQFRGKATLASDLYSLGCTAAFALCGSDPLALMQLSAADLPASTDSRLVDLVARLTDQDACVRPHSAAALYEELQNLRESLLKESRAALAKGSGHA